MSKLLITGGAGFIGSHLCDALVDGGHDAAYHPSRGRDPGNPTRPPGAT